MALGFKGTIADSLLNALLRAATYTGPASIFIQLHTAAPGAAGTSNVATNNTRKASAFSASSNGTIANTSDITWTSVPASETYTHFTLWDASSAGNFLLSGTVSSGTVVTGNNFTIASGTELGTLSVAS